MKHREEMLDRALRLFGSPSAEQIESAQKRVLNRLESGAEDRLQSDIVDVSPFSSGPRFRWPVFAAVATAVLIAVLLPVAMLRNTTWISTPAVRQRADSRPAQGSDVFDVVSIRRSSPLAGRGGGGRGRGRGGADAPVGPLPPCIDGNPQVFPGRFLFPNGTVYRLITLAYGKNCPFVLNQGYISGGPDWIKLDRFNIQATLPEGSPVFTSRQLSRGEAPKLQAMLRNLLVDRFNLELHRETKESPVYHLVLAKPGRIKLSEDQTPPLERGPVPLFLDGDPQAPRGALLLTPKPQSDGEWLFVATAIPMSTLVSFLQQNEDRMIIDKTEMTALFDVRLEFEVREEPAERAEPMKNLRPRLLEQLGLKMESARGPVEVLIIDRVEQPTEN